MLTIEQIQRMLDLQPHPEGGYFAETYRSPESVTRGGLPERYQGERCFGTAIYYMLTPDTFSELHRLESDEIFHFYLGDPVEMLQLQPDGSGQVVTLGTDIAQGMRPQILVSQGVWQGCRLIPGGRFALLGCTVAPGFEYVDYASGERKALVTAYPQFKERILALTRS